MLILADSKNAGTELLCNWRMTIIGFLAFSFCFSRTNMHHFYCRDWEGKWTYLVLERWRWWWCWPLILSVFSASRFGLTSSLPLLFYSSPCSALLRVSLFFSCISLWIISFLSSSLPYTLPPPFFFRMAPSPSLSLLLFRFSAPPSPLPFFFFSSPSRGGLYSLNNSSI